MPHSASPPVVQAARHEDAEQIRLLMRRVVSASVDSALQGEIMENVEANLAAWRNGSVEGVHLVATSDQSIIGVVLVKNFWNLCSLFVEQSHQGRGVGRSLVEAAALACASRSPRKALLLNAYPSAVGFYERLGFARRDAARDLPAGIQPMERAL
jgi:GNAT superfamily N-acetyltransferase